MIDLNLKVAQDRPSDTLRYFEPVQPANGADRWHLGGLVYRLDYVAVPRDGGTTPMVALERQTAQGRDYKGDRGRVIMPLWKLSALANEATLDAAKAHVQQVREALVRVLLDEQLAPEPELHPDTADVLADVTGPVALTLTAHGARQLAGHTGETLGQVEQAARRQGMTVEPQPEPAPSWGGPAATIPVDEDAPMLDEQVEVPVLGYDPNTHAAITDPLVVSVIGVLRDAHAAGRGLALAAADLAALVEYLGWQR